MRARRGRERAADDERQPRDRDARTVEPELPRHQRLGAPAHELEGEEDEHDRPCEQHHRQQQMGRHDRPAQVSLDREVAERRLRQGSSEERDRELLPSTLERRPEGRQRDEQRDQDRHAAYHPVPELDVGVVVLRRQRVAGLAAGPVAAAET